MKFVLESWELGPEEDCTHEAKQQLQITAPSSCQRGYPTITDCQLSKKKIEGKEKFVMGPR
jgi:hypothetical protein